MRKSIYSAEYRQFLLRLLQARKDNGITQMEIAEKLKIGQHLVSRIESGQRRIDIVEIVSIAKAYGKPIDYFVPWWKPEE